MQRRDLLVEQREALSRAYRAMRSSRAYELGAQVKITTFESWTGYNLKTLILL